MMILARAVFQAKFGKAADLVAAFKSMAGAAAEADMEMFQPRILTDISGRFDTVVVEMTHESLAALEQWRKATFAMADDRGESPITALVESGYNEYYTIET